jgi:hypothetical protein
MAGRCSAFPGVALLTQEANLDMQADYNGFKLAVIALLEQLVEAAAKNGERRDAQVMAQMFSRAEAEIGAVKLFGISDADAIQYRQVAREYLKGVSDMASQRSLSKQ